MKLFPVYKQIDIEPVKGKGSYIYDSDGNKYLDLFGGHAVVSIGHSNKTYVRNIKKQIDKIGFYSNAVLNNIQIRLADKLGKISGYAGYNLFLCNSGAEANENAMKIASFHNGRKKIIAFHDSFHGRTSLALAATDNPAIRAPVNETDNIIYHSLNDLSNLENLFLENEICAVIIEGIQGTAGIRIPDKKFIEEIERLCRKHDSVLIIDEIQSGNGRTGKFFAHQYYNIKPDLITVAKGMGNGFPVAGVLIHPKFKARYEMLGSTFAGSHLACVAALSVLEVLEKENLLQHSFEMGEYLKSKLRSIKGIKEIRGKGLMLGIDFNDEAEKIRQILLYEHKIYTGISWDKKTIRILPPLNIKKKDLKIFVKALKKILSE